MTSRCMMTVLPAVLVAAVLASGCNKNSQPTAAAISTTADQPSAGVPASQGDHDAIAAAIRQHLQENKGINMSVMDMTVDQITIQGDQAQAQTQFRLKQGGTTMSMTYALTRHADGWIVSTSQPSGGQFAHPPMDKVHSGNAPGTGADPSQDAAPGSASSTSGASGLPDVSDFFKKR